ncbi:hypothetical protein DPMN_017150 [Dreissena polymorpha]|uniref:HAT C-terminal dimerisation domain-containing protein n=1 Tax=Dreissena polymorpha TaxID=45954 RepID=A0A9D4S7V5_DREPO|nr:hypothetical protein DPMN_017150 [Dreissena polymorpha]
MLWIFRRNATQQQLDDQNYLLQTFLESPALCQDYPAMQYLIIVSHLVPTSTAVVERVFSLMTSVCSPLRTSLKQETLENLMRIVNSGQDQLTDAKLDTALAVFRNKKDRMVDF